MAPLARRTRRTASAVLAVLTALAAAVPVSAAAAGPGLVPAASDNAGSVVPDPLASGTRFLVPRSDPGARDQVRQLARAGRYRDAARVAAMVATPQAVWLTGGTAGEVERDVARALRRSKRQQAVATLVLYNVPGRDCSLYSAGGAAGEQAYRAWVDGVAAGLPASGRVVVVVEPDGLALLPSDCPSGHTGADVAELTRSRIAAIRYAGHRIRQANPDALVYLDAGNSNWHAVGEIARRLDAAGVRDLQGFALNVSNYEPTRQLLRYGSWISRCLHYVANPAEGGWRVGHDEHCASQYHPATFADESTWALTEEWYARNVDRAPNPPSGTQDLAHFVVDTSRNGRGPWTPAAVYPDPQTWCNPPGRGLGARPTVRTGEPLADALLWVKTPGQSDGQCNRGAGQETDPARGDMLDPPAGAWFPSQALELARLAVGRS